MEKLTALICGKESTRDQPTLETLENLISEYESVARKIIKKLVVFNANQQDLDSASDIRESKVLHAWCKVLLNNFKVEFQYSFIRI